MVFASDAGGVTANWACPCPSSPDRDFYFGPSRTVMEIGGQGSSVQSGPETAMQIYYKDITASASVAQLVECHPMNQKVADSTSSQGSCLGCGSVPSWKTTDCTPTGTCFFLALVSLSLSFSLPFPLPKIKNLIKKLLQWACGSLLGQYDCQICWRWVFVSTTENWGGGRGKQVVNKNQVRGVPARAEKGGMETLTLRPCSKHTESESIL